MGREYERRLVEITCDLCERKTEPQESFEDWQELSFEKYQPLGDVWSRIDLCPKCATKVGEWVKEQAAKS